MIKTVTVYKAQALTESVENLSLCAVTPFPNDYKSSERWMEEHLEIFVKDATAIVDALYASLPGGTLDQILCLMLQRKASQLIVKF